jgi:hypothetical protein
VLSVFNGVSATTYVTADTEFPQWHLDLDSIDHLPHALCTLIDDTCAAASNKKQYLTIRFIVYQIWDRCATRNNDLEQPATSLDVRSVSSFMHMGSAPAKGICVQMWAEVCQDMIYPDARVSRLDCVANCAIGVPTSKPANCIDVFGPSFSILPVRLPR